MIEGRKLLMKKLVSSVFLGGLLGLSLFSISINVDAAEMTDDLDYSEIQNIPWRSWEHNLFLVDKSNPPETLFFRTIIYNRIYSGYLGRTNITDGLYTRYEGYIYLEGSDRPIPARVLVDETDEND